MDYDESSIAVLTDAVAFIRKRPEMFVRWSTPEFLATALAGDALALGVKQVEIHHAGDWWAVASDDDWLAYRSYPYPPHNDLSVQDVFNRILPGPGSVNSCRSEVVIHALAASVFTTRAGSLLVLSGDEEVVRGLLARDPFCQLSEKRVVAFTMPRGGASCSQLSGPTLPD